MYICISIFQNTKTAMAIFSSKIKTTRTPPIIKVDHWRPQETSHIKIPPVQSKFTNIMITTTEQQEGYRCQKTSPREQVRDTSPFDTLPPLTLFSVLGTFEVLVLVVQRTPLPWMNLDVNIILQMQIHFVMKILKYYTFHFHRGKSMDRLYTTPSLLPACCLLIFLVSLLSF